MVGYKDLKFKDTLVHGERDEWIERSKGRTRKEWREGGGTLKMG